MHQGHGYVFSNFTVTYFIFWWYDFERWWGTRDKIGVFRGRNQELDRDGKKRSWNYPYGFWEIEIWSSLSNINEFGKNIFGEIHEGIISGIDK